MTPNEYVQAIRDEVLKLSIVHIAADQLGTPLLRLLQQHEPTPDYVECDHAHQPTGIGTTGYSWPAGVVEVAGADGMTGTCTPPSSVCTTCCTAGEEMTAAHGDHQDGPCWPCQVLRDVGADLGIEWHSEVSR